MIRWARSQPDLVGEFSLIRLVDGKLLLGKQGELALD